MKIAAIIVRILMGLLFLFASVTYLLKLFPQPEMHGDIKTFNEGLAASWYMMPLVKIIELLCAIAFLTGRFVPLATIIIFPIVINIFMFHSMLSPDGLPVAIFVLLGTLFLAYYYRKHYQNLFIAK